MLHIWKNEDNRLVEVREVCHGCWVSVVEPSKWEIDFLTRRLNLEPEIVQAALDEEETSRVETDESGTLLIVDLPLAEKQPDNTVLYSTLPSLPGHRGLCGDHRLPGKLGDHRAGTGL